ncbi:MAG: hypothetical protein HY744_07870 [Deltaproteobacteria bacterium]|nr:hypothetical protein [Deltaproteobacteria bacterium]
MSELSTRFLVSPRRHFWPTLGALLLGGAGLLVACGSDVSVFTTGGAGTGSGAGGGVGGASAAGGSGGSASSSGAGAGHVAGAGPGGGVPVQCPGVGSPCTECLAEKCQDLWCACYGETACAKLLACVQSCGPEDQGCGQGCLGANAEGASDFFLLIDCSATACHAGCPESKPLNPCEKCVYTECSAQMETCLGNPECMAIFQCTDQCGGQPGCGKKCMDEHPGGAQDAFHVHQCVQAECPGKC